MYKRQHSILISEGKEQELKQEFMCLFPSPDVTRLISMFHAFRVVRDGDLEKEFHLVTTPGFSEAGQATLVDIKQCPHGRLRVDGLHDVLELLIPRIERREGISDVSQPEKGGDTSVTVFSSKTRGVATGVIIDGVTDPNWPDADVKIAEVVEKVFPQLARENDKEALSSLGKGHYWLHRQPTTSSCEEENLCYPLALTKELHWAVCLRSRKENVPFKGTGCLWAREKTKEGDRLEIDW